MEHTFLSAGLEAYYAGDNHSTVYIIVTGVVRVMLEPTNTSYCRAVDLTGGDTFALQALTRPLTPMMAQPLALTDVHLIALPRVAFTSVLGPDSGRWRVSRGSMEKAKRILLWSPKDRMEADVQVESMTPNPKP
jgi:CRP-like cAMP-binding protein